MNACNFSSVVSNRPSISWLTWLFKNGFLSEISFEFDRWITSKTYNEFESFDEFETVETQRDLLGKRVDVIELAEELSGWIRYHYSRANPPEAIYIAEYFLSIDFASTCSYQRQLSEIFLFNWKFDRFMYRSPAAVHAFLHFIVNPQIRPIDTSYQDLLSLIKRTIEQYDSNLTIERLARYLLRKNIHISEVFLESIVLNSEELLFLHKDGEKIVVIASIFFQNWYMAAELLDAKSYLKSKGLNYDNIPFFQVSFTPFMPVLRRFFDLHNKNIDWECIDDLEFAIKIRYTSNLMNKKIQDIPFNTFFYILEWIKKNDSVWSFRNAERILGARLAYKAEDIPPGILLVYGHPSAASSPDRLGFVCRDMVSVDYQVRGKIHPKRVLTPFVNTDLKMTTEFVESLLQAAFQSAQNDMVLLGPLINTCLIQRGGELKPYNIRSITKSLLDSMPSKYRFIGKELIVAAESFTFLENCKSEKQCRLALRQHFNPRSFALSELLESFDGDEREIIRRIFT